MTTGMLVVLAIVICAVVLFVLEPIPVDMTAMAVLVSLVILQPWTGISPAEGVSGFSNPATITVLAMLILSEGVRRSGVVQLLGNWLSKIAAKGKKRQLAFTIGLAGPLSGFINNTPVVALMIPMVTDMAHRGKLSPSKLLIPLSYASMMGGMLTLIGTSTNLLASDLSGRLIGRSFSMFEFTQLGAVVLLVGGAYLMLVAPSLLPERVKPREDYLQEYDVGAYLTEVQFTSQSPLIGTTVGDFVEDSGLELDVIAQIRGDESFSQPVSNKEIRPDDIFVVHASRGTLKRILNMEGLVPSGTYDFEEGSLGFDSLVEVIIPPGSEMIGKRIKDLLFAENYDAVILALRHHGETIRERIEEQTLRAGDTLLLQGTERMIEGLRNSPSVVVLRSEDTSTPQPWRIGLSLAVVAAVVLVAALDILPIMVSALTGVVAMVVFGLLRPNEIYDSVDWNVIFLLAGIIPLGLAMQETGLAGYLGRGVALTSTVLPALAVLWVFYIATALITEIISNNASVLLMIPVAVETATSIGANPFSFVLVVTFAASMAFMGPIGYQTNLFVYGPGGYKVSDFFRVGAPLQAIMSVVVVCGIYVLWGV
ncbi:MAG: SLC13 family permease [Myxococcota bacterium]